MPTNAYAYYDFAGAATNTGRADEYYDLAGTPTHTKSGDEYYDFNGLTAIDNKVEWFHVADGETNWQPGLIWNGCEFVRYAMWNGQCWQSSFSEDQVVWPTGVVSGVWDNDNSNAFVDLPAVPAGTTTAIALVGTMHYGDITLPAGWRLLGSTSVGTGALTPGGSGYIRKAVAVAIDNVTGTEGLRFNFSNALGDSYNMKCYSYAYFSGGGKGTWNAVKGQEYVATSYAQFTDIPVAAPPRLWWQTGILTAIYTGYTTTASDFTLDNNGFMQNWIKPAGGTQSGSAFKARYIDGHPATSADYIDSTNIGAYGQPNSTSWGFWWTPSDC